MQRSIFLFLLLLIYTLTITGCNDSISTEYDIITKDSNYFISLNKDFKTDNYTSYESGIYFDSLNDLLDKFNNKSFSKSELEIISTFTKNEDGLIKVFDIKNAYEPSFKDGFTVDNIYWEGDTYSYYFTNNSLENNNGYISFYNKENYDKIYKSEYVDTFDNELITINKYEYDEDNNIYIYEYSTSLADLTSIRYEVTNDNLIVKVDELYVINSYNNLLPASDKCPIYTHIFYETGDIHCFITIHNMIKKIDAEFINNLLMEKILK